MSNRGGTSRENTGRVGYLISMLKPGPDPGRVYPMQIDKTPQYVQACLREYAERLLAKRWIGQQFQEISCHKDLAHI